MSLDYYHKHGWEDRMLAIPPDPTDTGQWFINQAHDPNSWINYTFDQIDKLSAVEYNDMYAHLEQKYYHMITWYDDHYYDKHGMDPEHLDPWQDGMFRWQMAAQMRAWAGGVRNQWMDIYNEEDDVKHVTGGNSDQRKGDLMDVKSNLEVTMLKYTASEDQHIRARIIHEEIVALFYETDEITLEEWASVRMLYDMYSVTFADD